MKVVLIWFVIFAYAVQCYSGLDRMVRIQGGTEGVGAGYLLLMGHFSVSGSGVLKVDMQRLFSDTDSNIFYSFNVTPEVDAGVLIKTKKGHLIVPFVGIAIPIVGTKSDSTGEFLLDEYFRLGSDYFFTRNDLPFINIGGYISINDTGIFGLGFRIGITALHRNKAGVKTDLLQEIQ